MNIHNTTLQSKSRLGPIALVVLLSLLLGACGKAELKGDNETFMTSGTANDSDPTNGAAVVYTNPARTGADGATSATSDPKSFRQLGGHVIARPGPNAPAGSSAAATATNKVTSTFNVRKQDTYQYDITTTLTAALNRGAGKVHVVARVLDQNNAMVQGSDYQLVYTLVDKGNGQLGITINNPPEILVANPANGWQDGNRVGPAQAFTLNPGQYTMQFEVNFEATAPIDGSADVKGIASVDLK